jgi:hypothetical protein
MHGAVAVFRTPAGPVGLEPVPVIVGGRDARVVQRDDLPLVIEYR